MTIIRDPSIGIQSEKPPKLQSAVRGELARIREKFASADAKAKAASAIADRVEAEAERREAEGDFWAAGQELADLLLLLLRYGNEHRREALRLYGARPTGNRGNTGAVGRAPFRFAAPSGVLQGGGI